MEVPPAEFIRSVRQALAHLYDYAYLQDNPLAAMLDPGKSLDRVARAQKLRRSLLQCIQALGPQVGDGAPSEAARVHSILTYRYLDGLSIVEIASKRALSPRQAYREHERGVEAVAGLLWDRVREELGPADIAGLAGDQGPAGDQLQMAQVEVARLRQAVRTESFPLLEAAEATLRVLAPLVQRTGAQVTVAAAEAWPLVAADRVLLRQALLNLLSHALGAVSAGHSHITISASRNGLAIEAPAAPEASGERSEATPPARQREVGLSVARALLEAQGGGLELRQAQGRWQAQVWLPRVGRATVLVIDDNESLVSLLQRYLAGHQVNVVAATEGEQALRLAADLQPQLITLDLMMPGLDGWDILQTLKGSPKTSHIPVVVCSVLSEVQLAESMGASGYITKPVSQANLLAVLRRWLGPLQPSA